jgi:DNA-binding NarL/FixJ family response regulator
LSAIGHTVEIPTDVLAWVRRGQGGLVLLTLEAESDWELLDQLHAAAPTHVVVALVAEESAGLGVRAVRAGARSVLPHGVTVDVLQRTVEATIDGQAVMPAVVAAALAAGTHTTAAPPQGLSPEQLSWLRHLAAGEKVAQLARQAGYSERAMYRLLHSLYKEMGVPNRLQAIIRAQEQGWLLAETDAIGPTRS